MIRANRERFLHILESVQPGLSQKDIVQQSSCFCFRNGEVIAFDEELCCRAPTKLPEDFEAAVVHKPLLEQLKKWKEEEIELQLGDGELILIGKGRKAGIRMEAEITLPLEAVESELPKEKEWQKLHEEFTEAVGIVQLCAGKDESQFATTCVHVHPKWVEANDNTQMCRWKLKTGFADRVLLRKTGISNITSLGMQEFCETKTWVHFRNANGVIISCQRFVEDFANLNKVLDKVEGHEASLPKGLVEACDKALVFTQENPENDLVSVSIQKERIEISGQGVSGWYKERKKLAKYDGPAIQFLIKPQLLSDLVKRHTQCTISERAIRVDSGSYVYVSCLTRPKETHSTHSDNGEAEKPRKKRVVVAQEE